MQTIAIENIPTDATQTKCCAAVSLTGTKEEWSSAPTAAAEALGPRRLKANGTSMITIPVFYTEYITLVVKTQVLTVNGTSNTSRQDMGGSMASISSQTTPCHPMGRR